MFCQNCGSEIDDRAAICPHCGVPTGIAVSEAKEETNVLAIVGFILSLLIPIAGLVCSILGMKKAKQLHGKGHGLAVAGLVISIVLTAITAVSAIYWLTIYFATLDAIFGSLGA